MKKFIFLLTIALLLVPQANSVSSSLRETYAPRETMIGELTGMLAPVNREQVKVVKDGHLDVAVQFDVAKLGNKYFIWLIAPTNTGSYTLIIQDVVTLVNGAPEVMDYRKDFLVQGAMANYSVAPGFVLTNRDFNVVVDAYSEAEINVDFPEQRTVSLYPGTNYVDFSIADVLGTQQITINLGMYKIPAYILGADYICGDGKISGREVCDGTNLNGQNCTTVPGGFVGGQLKCFSTCLSFDNSLCQLSGGETCNSEHFNLCLNQTSCTSASGHWYNSTCNQYEQGAICDLTHVGLCKTQGTCLDVRGYWYNETCHDGPAPVCGSGHLSLCLTHGTCLDAGGYWYNNTCNDKDVGECGDKVVNYGEECDGTDLRNETCVSRGFDLGNLGCIAKGLQNECKFNLTECYLNLPLTPLAFGVYPEVIRSKVLLNEEIPVYRFSITNEGTSEIIGLRLDYNAAKFTIVPDKGINISVNETANFNVTIKDVWKGTPFRGVAVAYAGDVYKEIFFEINFTNIEAEAVTEYSKNSTSQGPSYYCSELLGLSCGSEETCNGDMVSTIDVSKCCVGSCESQSSGSGRAWIGYFIAGIVLLVVIILYLKYKKTGKSHGSPLQSGIMQATKNLP